MNYPIQLAARPALSRERSRLSAPARCRRANVIRGDRRGRQRDGAVELVIRGSRAPSYSVFKLQDPQRLVVDLAGADVSAHRLARARRQGRRGLASPPPSTRTSGATVGRVIVTLDGAQRYEVVPRGDAVVVRVLQGRRSRPPAARARPPTPAGRGDDARGRRPSRPRRPQRAGAAGGADVAAAAARPPSPARRSRGRPPGRRGPVARPGRPGHHRRAHRRRAACSCHRRRGVAHRDPRARATRRGWRSTSRA